MVSSSQKRILTWLNQFSPGIEKVWDVTREISLPGIADGLGVVRSALNLPLKNLEETGMVFKRMAHVIGGGSRRRQVFHLTDQGREFILQNKLQTKKKTIIGQSFGNMPKFNHVFGRENSLKQISDELENSSLVICGLPGIGKTTLVSELCQQLMNGGKTVRWALATEFSDIFDICLQWQINGPLPNDILALQEVICQNSSNEVLIIDDIHQISNRHIQAFEALCEKFSNLDNPRIILIGREPITNFSCIPKIQVEPLDEESGAKLLGEVQSLEIRMSISRRLGGHPLALQLYHPESELPEQSIDIQNYVEETVLSNLKEKQKSLLNLLSLEPIPIKSDNSLVSEMIGFFDDQALLRWSSNNSKVEVHHLIRNVRRLVLGQEKQKNLHKSLAEHWEGLERTEQENLILLYHQIASSNDDMVELIEQQLANLSPSKSNALAVLLEQAIEQKSDNSDLHFLAAKVAIQRCEISYVKNHMKFVEDERAVGLNLELALLEGRTEDAEKLLLESLDNADPNLANRLAISAAARRLDDRIFDEKINAELLDDVKRYLSKVRIEKIHDRSKSASIIAITMIKHSLSLLENDIKAAEKLTESVKELGLDADALTLNLCSKEKIFHLKNGETSVKDAVQFIQKAATGQSNSIYSDSIRLNLVEALLSIDLELAEQQFELLSKPDYEIKLNTYHRYIARWWLCKSIFYPLEKLTCLRESISQHRIAGCSRAAKALEKRLHSLI